jgi:RNA polymerase sigma-70 factor (ECF subfamily)
VLSRQQRLTYEQIGSRLGIARETVKTHIELAVASITRYVKSEMDKALLLLWIAITINGN